MVLIDSPRWNIDDLSARYRSASPFPHVVIDDFVEPKSLAELALAFDEEPADNIQDEIFDVMASASPPVHPAFREIRGALSSPLLLDGVSAITGAAVRGRGDASIRVPPRALSLAPRRFRRGWAARGRLRILRGLAARACGG
jgi:hypothetical protein